MNLALDDDERLLAESADRFRRERGDLDAHRAAIRGGDGFSRERWAEMADFGWLALAVPESAGGLGGSLAQVGLVAEALGRGLMTEPFVESAVLSAHVLTVADRRDWLDRLVGGHAIVTLAHLEDGLRNDFETAVATQAHRSSPGFRLQGAKVLAVHAPAADAFLVSAALDGEFALFLVPRDVGGLALTSYPLVDGTRAADLAIDRVELPASAVLLRGAQALSTLHDALDRALLAASARSVGAIEDVIERTVGYVQTRKQFGQPLAQFQAVQHLLADMAVEATQARSILLRALAAAESGDPSAGSRAISAAKALIGRVGHFVAATGIQLHGGVGVTEEYAVGHHYKALVAYARRFGDGEFHLQRASPGACE